MFSKEPVVYANPHPDEQDYGYMSAHPANQKNASLRVRSNHQSLSNTDAEQSSPAIDV